MAKSALVRLSWMLSLMQLRLPMVAARYGYDVKGVTGEVDIANGFYTRLGTEWANGYPVYVNLNRKGPEQVVLARDETGFWVFQPRSLVGQKQGYIISSQRLAPFPHGAGPWLMHGVGNTWVEKDKVSVELVPETQQPRVRKAIAFMVFGALLAIAALLSLTGSYDPRLRSMAYALLSALLAVFIAQFVTEGIEQPLLYCFPRDQIVRLGAELALFTAGFLSISFFGWKLQFSRSYLAVVNTLCAFLVAFWGLAAATEFYNLCSEKLSKEFAGVLTESTSRQSASTLAATLVVAAILFILSWAAVGNRYERFALPPIHPWMRRSQSASAPPAGRTCFPVSASGAPQPADVQGMNWQETVVDAEDLVTAIVVGRMLLRCLTDALGKNVTSGQLGKQAMYLIVLAIFVAGSLALWLARANARTSDRAMSVVQRTIGMAAVWTIQQAEVYLSSKYLEDFDDGLMSVGVAFVESVTCVALAIVFQLVLRLVLGSLAGTSPKAGGGLGERTMHDVCQGLGFLMGLMWAKAYSRSLTQLTGALLDKAKVNYSDTPGRRRVFDTLVGAFLALLLLRPFFVVLLPKARMSEAEHLKAIQQEAAQMERI